MAPIENQPSPRQAADYPSKNEFGDQSSPVPATKPIKSPKPHTEHHDERDTMPEELPLDVPMRHTEQ